MRFIVSETGDVLAPDGYCGQLSSAVTAVVAGNKRKLRSRRLGFIRAFLNDLQDDGEDDYAFAKEDCAASVARIERHLQSFGLQVTACSNGADPDRRDVHRPDGPIDHHAQRIATIRRLYREMNRVGLAGPANPAEIDGWHEMKDEERRDWWAARQKSQHDDRSYMHAGSRFRCLGRTAFAPSIMDCVGARETVMDAVRASGAEPNAVALLQVMADNGQRYEDTHCANALGWWSSQFGDWFLGRNKGEGVSLVKPLLLSGEMLQQLLRAMTARPHPHDPESSMMDWLRECGSRGDHEALASVLLFPNPKGRPYPYTTLLGKVQRPCAKIGLKIESDVGRLNPSLSLFRRAHYSEELQEIYATAGSDEEIAQRSQQVGRDLGHKTDQSERYAGKIKRLEAVKRQRASMARRKIAVAAARAGLPAKTRSQPLASLSAEQAHNRLPSRRDRT